MSFINYCYPNVGLNQRGQSGENEKHTSVIPRLVEGVVRASCPMTFLLPRYCFLPFSLAFVHYYKIAKQNGALGGKIIGAGGGGFFMFYTNTRENKKKLRKEFIKHGLMESKMPFEPEGTKIILNLAGRTS